MSDLFARFAAPPPDALAAQPSSPAERRSPWRQPDRRREHVCGPCGSAAVYGLGNAWFCTTCVPAGFLPHTRGQCA